MPPAQPRPSAPEEVLWDKPRKEALDWLVGHDRFWIGKVFPEHLSGDFRQAIAAYAFRNGFLEEFHSGQFSELLESDKWCRITDAEMKKLMIECSAKVEELLRMARDDSDYYQQFVRRYSRDYCRGWER